MTRKRFLTLFVFIFLLAACGGGASQSESILGVVGGDFDAEEPTLARENAVGSSTANTSSSDTQTSFNQAQQPETQERLIIRTGNIDIVVEDPEASLTDIGRLADRLGGWVVTSEVRQTSQEAKAGAITLRIPADQFDEMVSQVKAMALEVTWESTNSQDVTDEFVDLSSRLGNLEATADRVRAFLDTAKDVEEALAVNQELSRLEEEIEVIKGRMQFLSQSAAFSTLTVSLTPDTESHPIEVAGWRPDGTAKDAIETLVRTLQGIADIGIVAGLYFLPLALLFGIPGYFLFRIGRNWQRRRTETQPTPASE